MECGTKTGQMPFASCLARDNKQKPLLPFPDCIGSYVTPKLCNQFIRKVICRPELRNEQGGVTVAEETETVAQGIAVDGFPVAVYKGRYKQQ